MTIKLGVPSKGRLMEKTFDWFGARGVVMVCAPSTACGGRRRSPIMSW